MTPIIGSFLLATIIALAAIKLAFERGKEVGRVTEIRARTKYLDARISGAQKRVTALSVSDYEEHAALTVTSDLYGKPDWFHHLCFKLSGETGEFMEHIGKASRDDGWSIFAGVRELSADRKMALLKELGDILWYIAMLAKELGSSLMQVMLINIEKCESRRQRGVIKGAGDNR